MNNIYIALNVGTAFLSSVSQIMLNISARKEHKNKLFEYLNPWVIGSYCILAFVLAANIYIMRFIPLKNAHAVAACTYLFTMILSRIILKERLTVKKVIGNIAIIAGIIIFIN